MFYVIQLEEACLNVTVHYLVTDVTFDSFHYIFK